ncbi:MAG TPA: pyruvate kinase alpha/beta domain-containing protein, partial [Candidatus Acidoferrales bacterium]|nr:pyruvate kinase alpha/beta domain-containing protein [Candidatus Acidoferrales bacterium]
IIAVTPEINVKKQLELVFGVKPILINYLEEKDMISAVAHKLSDLKLIDSKETVLFTAGKRTMMKHASNAIEIHKIEELLNFSPS